MISLTSDQLLGILAALGGGLLVGVQRERHKEEHSPSEPAGVRTFTLVALVGAVAAFLGTTLAWLAGAAVAAFAVTAYLRRADREPGLTTEVALFATYLLGVMAMTAPSAAAGLFVVLVALLQTKQALHHFTRSVLSERELGDALLLAASVLIVLPMLPDRTFDPFHVLNPRRIWLFAVLVMSINAAGYIALRVFGARRGLLLAGFFGGFVSSTATIAGMGQRARTGSSLTSACVAAALLSNVATVIQLTVIIVVAAPSMLPSLGPALLIAGITAVVAAAVFFWRSDETNHLQTPQGRPFDPVQALIFAGIVAFAAWVAALLRDWMGTGGMVVAAALAGFADVHAAAIGLAQLSTETTADLFAYALTAAFTANSVVKCIASGIGGRAFAIPVIGGVGAINVAMLFAVWITARTLGP